MRNEIETEKKGSRFQSALPIEFLEGQMSGYILVKRCTTRSIA